MIHDFGTEVKVAYPAIGVGVEPSDAYDLLGGTTGGGNDVGVPALFGTGERLHMQFEVTAAFVEAGTAPRLLFGIAISGSDPIATADMHILGLTGGKVINDEVGFAAAQLTLGRVFHLPVPAWEDVIESVAGNWPLTIGAAELTTFRALRYMGIVCYNTNILNGTNYFTAGEVKGRIIKDHGGMAVLSSIYPSRMGVK